MLDTGDKIGKPGNQDKGGIKRQMTDNRKQTTESRRQMTDGRKQQNHGKNYT